MAATKVEIDAAQTSSDDEAAERSAASVGHIELDSIQHRAATGQHTAEPSHAQEQQQQHAATNGSMQHHAHQTDAAVQMSSAADLASAFSEPDTGSEASDADAAASAPSNFDVAQLFPSGHVPQWTLPLLLYFPFGCALGVTRMAIWILLLAVDSDLLTNNDTMIKVFYTILGIRVTWRGAENLPQERHVVVSNHVTVGDLMVLYARPRSYVHLITSRLPQRVTQAKNHRVKLRYASGEVYKQLEDSRRFPDPVHLFPEGGMTNGRGMMKFSRGFMRFGGELPIVPAAMRAEAAFGISTHTLTSSFLANMFWFCFAPYVSLEVTVLPPMQPRKDEGKAFFVQRVQQAIADELGIPIADITLQQKHKLY